MLQSFVVFAASVFASVPAQAAPAWNLNDVSILYPLPKATEEADVLLGAADRGLRGELLPFEVFEKLESPIPTEIDRRKLYDRLRVVGFRIDPADNTIRFVWQPLQRTGSQGAWTTEDGAIHTFYTLSDEAFANFLNLLRALKRDGLYHDPLIRTERLPLGVHPAFRHPRYASTFRESLRLGLLQNCGTETLTQATVMQLTLKEIWWKFAGVKRDTDGEFRPLTIARMDSETQDLFQESLEVDPVTGHATGMKGALLPHFPEGGEMDLRPIIRAYHVPNEGDRAEFRAKLKVIHRIENPRVIKNETLDCAHCHLAQPTRGWMTKNLQNLEVRGQTDRDRFRNPRPLYYNLTNTSVSTRSTKIFRAFGYFNAEPAINQRAIHESADVADRLSSLE